MAGFDPISAALDIGGKLIDRLWPDPTERDKAKLELLKMQQEGELKALTADIEMAKGQIDVNKAEAASGNPYASSWRPTIGYVGAAALAWGYVFNPIAIWLAAIFNPGMHLPDIKIDDHLWELIMGILGLAGWRSYDKKQK